MSGSQAQLPPDVQQVVTQMQQAGIDQSAIDIVINMGQTTAKQLQTLTTGLAQVQYALSSQQKTIANVQSTKPTTVKLKTDVKIEKPNKFDGIPKKFRDWIFNFEQFCKITTLDTQPNEQAQYAVTLFEQAALTWWQVQIKLKPATLDLSTLDWSTLKSEMEAQFVDSDRTRKLMHQFSTFTQVADLQSYVQNFRKLVLELGNLVTDESVLWQFVRGLKPNLQKEVLKDPNLVVVSDAILIAERLDAAEKFSSNFQNYRTKNQQYRQQIMNDHSTPMDIDTLYQMQGRGGYNSTRGRTQQYTRGRSQQNFSGRSGTGRSVECYYCQQKGHYARDCYKKQRDDAHHQLHLMSQQMQQQPSHMNQHMHNINEVLPLPPQTMKNMGNPFLIDENQKN